MKTTSILLARALRLLQRKAPFYIPEAVERLRVRYGFVRVPKTAQEMLPEQNGFLVFEHGRFVQGDSAPIHISSLYVSDRTLAVDIEGSTDDADIIVDDVLAFCSDLVVVNDPRRLYTSQVELRLDVALDVLMSAVAAIGDRLSQLVGSYRIDEETPVTPPPAFRISSLLMNADPSKYHTLCDFRIERRAGTPWEENLYFSQAPLRTQDHIAFLEELERIITSIDRAEALKQ